MKHNFDILKACAGELTLAHQFSLTHISTKRLQTSSSRTGDQSELIDAPEQSLGRRQVTFKVWLFEIRSIGVTSIGMKSGCPIHEGVGRILKAGDDAVHDGSRGFVVGQAHAHAVWLFNAAYGQFITDPVMHPLDALKQGERRLCQQHSPPACIPAKEDKS
ncbi:hypothetical protein KJ359_008579 [Pestalotiopsis sp. 9143b]|nr:hypothetical protein KJ359_008579 [Pestalotiopsis sp. 9143b]